MPLRYSRLGPISSGRTFIKPRIGSDNHHSTAPDSGPISSASHSAWRTSGPVPGWSPAPWRWATLAVVASRVPVISRNIGIQMELPSATAARSCGLARPAITASTKPMAVVASCAIMIGAARVSSSLSSARMRKPRERGRAGLFTAVLVWAGEPRSLRVDGVVRKGQQGRAGCPAPHRATRRQTTPRCPLEARPRRANNRLAVIRRIPVTAADDMPWKRRTSPPDFSAASLRRPGIG